MTIMHTSIHVCSCAYKISRKPQMLTKRKQLWKGALLILWQHHGDFAEFPHDSSLSSGKNKTTNLERMKKKLP